MFPWVCLAELPLFFKVDWPRTVISKFLERSKDHEYSAICHQKETMKSLYVEKKELPINQQLRRRKKLQESITSTLNISNKSKEEVERSPNCLQKLRVLIILFYCLLQFFLPYSHFITKGYNNWTNGMYGYSWDMMVHSYDTILTSIKIVDNSNGRIHYLEPYAFSEYDRWTKHADMAKQYAECIERNLIDDFEMNPRTLLRSKNFSIYFDIWCSMNGRFQQRVYDPRVDILHAKWSPFYSTKWVLPLLNELNYMRPKLNAITKDVLTWNNHSDVMFIADFPGLTMENFISPDLDNVTLTVLQGAIQYKSEEDNNSIQSISAGQSLSIRVGQFHLVTTISNIPSCYMYTYLNRTMRELKVEAPSLEYDKPILPIWSEILERVTNYKTFFYHVGNSIMFLLYGVPMPVRIRERE